jgi:hypothetical protein
VWRQDEDEEREVVSLSLLKRSDDIQMQLTTYVWCKRNTR